MIKFMEKIFSDLAYQIAKFLFFVLVLIAICLIVDKENLLDIIGLRVDAATVHYVMDQYETSDAFYPYDCTSSTSCSTTIDTKAMILSNDYNNKTIYATKNNVTLDSTGLNISYALNQVLEPGYMYSVRTLICHNSSIGMNGVSYSGLTAGSAYNSPMAYSSTTSGNFISGNVVMEGGLTSMQKYTSHCSVYNSIISPKNEGGWFSLRITRSSSLSSPLYMIGYQISNLGNYDPNLASSITKVVQNSAIKTQQDIQELNDKISDMTEQQTQTNEKLDNINDTLTDSDTSENTANDFFDSSSISSSDGVVSALLTLPIQMASKFVDNLGGTCSPYKMNFGMLGKEYTLNLPCIDLEDYLGANLWHVIDLLFCGFMAYNIAMLFISIYDSITSLQDYYYSYIYQSSHEEHTRENRRARTPSE